MRAVWIVAKRELKTRLMSKAAIISTIIFVLLIAGGIQVVGYFINSDDTTVTTVGVSEATEPLGEIVAELGTMRGEETTYLPIFESAATEHLTDGNIDMYIAGTPTAPVFMFDGNPDGSLVTLGTDAATQYLIYASLDPTDVAEIESQLAELSIDVVDVNPVTSERTLDPVKIVTAFALISLLFFALIQSASLVIVGVIEEKASRVVEILLATIRPSQLLAGKVLGIGMLALIQLVLFAGAAALSASAAGLFDFGQVSIGWSILSLLGWFFLGFALFMALFGGLASLVSRQEDAGAVTTPMIFGLMIPFYLAIYLIPNAPDALATKVLSQIPFFAPFMMPIRSAFEAVAFWEIALSVGLCLVTIPVVIWIGGRVYSRAVLHTGGRVKLRDALRG